MTEMEKEKRQEDLLQKVVKDLFEIEKKWIKQLNELKEKQKDKLKGASPTEMKEINEDFNEKIAALNSKVGKESERIHKRLLNTIMKM